MLIYALVCQLRGGPLIQTGTELEFKWRGISNMKRLETPVLSACCLCLMELSRVGVDSGQSVGF